jgi:hypothetical protein
MDSNIPKHRGGARPGAGRPKKVTGPLSQEQRISILEQKLRNPNCSAKDAASLERKISILKGEVKTYSGKGGIQSEVQKQDEKERQPESLVYQHPEQSYWYWTEYIEQRVLGGDLKPLSWPWHPRMPPTNKTLDRAEYGWAQALGVSVEQLRELIRQHPECKWHDMEDAAQATRQQP